jgi:hypothetical protein
MTMTPNKIAHFDFKRFTNLNDNVHVISGPQIIQPDGARHELRSVEAAAIPKTKSDAIKKGQKRVWFVSQL